MNTLAKDTPIRVELGSGTYILTPLPNGRYHVAQRGSGLQGSMLRDGTDGPSWLRINDMLRLATVAKMQRGVQA